MTRLYGNVVETAGRSRLKQTDGRDNPNLPDLAVISNTA
jgi:hypothetical protein